VRASILAAAAIPEVAARLPSDADVAVRLTGDRELRRLNRRFMGDDAATDVLSFPAGDAGGTHVGDIALSLRAVARQAVGFGHPVGAEGALLSIHGFLHLLGWDHSTAAEEQEMNRLTRAALGRLGIGIAADRLGT
jgi:probable rRNA maturation factor